jgi:metal transporter CNNM
MANKVQEFARQIAEAWAASPAPPIADGLMHGSAHPGGRYNYNNESSDGSPDVPCCGFEFWMYIVLCLSLVCFAAIMAGLTVAYMSLDALNIQIIEASGTDHERKYARAILPLLKNRHLLLVTLLIGNATAMEALPIFLDRLVSPYMAILLSVTMVLIFGEILPQAICAHYSLPIGAFLSRFVMVLQLLCSPIAWPVSKLLHI